MEMLLRYINSRLTLTLILPLVKRFCGDYSLNLYCYHLYEWECDNDNGKYYKYVCITTNQPDTK